MAFAVSIYKNSLFNLDAVCIKFKWCELKKPSCFVVCYTIDN